MLVNQIAAYGYPSVIDKVISEFVCVVKEVFHDNKVGVLLIGSASRGELCWAMVDGKAKLFSDIEFIIAVDSVPDKKNTMLLERVHILEEKYPLGQRFNLDYVVIKWSNLNTVEKRILVFDSKNAGIDLTKNSVAEKLPEVTRANINFNELNDVLLHRMKSIIVDVPEDLVANLAANNDYVLSIAKNSLDITTWLFPYESENLVSGFENRLNIWKEKKSEIILSEYIDDDFKYLTDCINVRKHPEKEYIVASMLSEYISIYDKAISYCKKMNQIGSNEGLARYKVSKTLFFEYKVRRRLIEALYIIKNANLFCVSNMLSNIFLPRKGRQIEFCIEMINALNAYLNSSEDECRQYLDVSWRKLRLLRKIKKGTYNNTFEEWLYLRNSYTALNKIFI